MLISVDVGKYGALVLMDLSGNVVDYADMPKDKAGICPYGIAAVYKRFRDQLEIGETPRVFIEKIFTPPTDAISQKQLDGLIATKKSAEELILARDGDYLAKEHFDAVETNVRPIGEIKSVRLDGRVGVQNYSKGYGYLFMPAIWGWPIMEIAPRTWMAKMYKHCPGNLKGKDRSIYLAKARWPHLFTGKKKMDGLADAALIGEWARLHLVGAKEAS